MIGNCKMVQVYNFLGLGMTKLSNVPTPQTVTVGIRQLVHSGLVGAYKSDAPPSDFADSL